MKEIIKASLKHSITYDSYISMVERLVEEGATTGLEKTEALVNFTALNQKRMKRWDKTLKISEAQIAQIKTFDTPVIWLLITESWCGDAAHVVPVINKVASYNDKIDLQLVLRDENLELIDAFLTNGGRSIPKLIVLEANTLEVLHTFGPRPSKATTLVADYKAKHGKLTPEFKEELQLWYNKDKGQTTINDLISFMA